jgi:endogenous inhibitor of DNA gyrase (YacG/DUF329 family)
MERCATCKKPVDPRTKNPSAPFCSVRCRQVDLGKWLNGEHSLPGESVSADADREGANAEGAESS